MSEASKIIVAVKEPIFRDLLIFSLQSEMYFDVLEVNNAVHINSTIAEEDNVKLVILDDVFGHEAKNVVKNYLLENVIDLRLFFLSKNIVEISSTSDGNVLESPEIAGDYLSSFMSKIKEYFLEDCSSPKKKFVPIMFRTLTRFKGLSDEAYIKLSKEKYVKLFQIDDQVTNEDVTKYARRGISTLYFDKMTTKWILKRLNKYVSKTMVPENPSPQIDINETENSGEKAFLSPIEKKQVLNALDIDDEMISDINKQIDCTKKLVSKSPALDRLLRTMNVNRDKNNYYNSHVDILSTVSCGLARKLGWYTPSTLEKLIFVSQIHDLILIEDPMLARINNINELNIAKPKLTDHQVRLIIEHPARLAELVRQLPIAPVESDKIILQHHELPDKSGFPQGLSGNRIIPMAVLFIIAHDLTDYILNNPNWKMRSFKKLAFAKFKHTSFRRFIDVLDGN